MLRRLLAAMLAVVVGAGLGLVFVASPATAAPAPPSGLSPSGGSVADNPVLSWTPVIGATAYRVELSQSSNFDSLSYSVTTANRQATPASRLPSGQLYWRVRAVDAAGGVSPWTAASFSLNPKAAPTQLTPADGAVLAQPQQPPQLTWQAVNGANSYELAVGTDPNLSTASTYTTSTTSYSFTTPQGQATYYWKVRAVIGGGQATNWSGTRSYVVGALAHPILVSPRNSPDTFVSDVVLEWTSVPGASKYEVRVSNDQSFSDPVAVATSVATRWSPPVTLNNDQYWWQVRAYDSQGQTYDWPGYDETWQFERRWQFEDPTILKPERPVLVYPTDQTAPVVEDPLYYEWQPVQLASEYKLQVGTDRNFSPDTFAECSTKETTYTPSSGLMTNGSLGCMPRSGGTYFWRVQAVDQSRPVVTPWSDIRTFRYRSGSPAYIAPADGATVTVPTMAWHQVMGAERYKLTYSYGPYTKSIDTYATSYTPFARFLSSSPTITWSVKAVFANGDASPVGFGGERTFTLADPPTPTATAPDALPVEPSGDRFPALTWKPVAGATSYRVWIGDEGTTPSIMLPEKYAYPAMTDTSKTYLGSKAYDWVVVAYDASNLVIASGSLGSFSIQNVGAASGQGVAQTGSQLDTALRCSRTIRDTPVNSCPVSQTPVLDWDPVAGASFYQVTLARDESLTNRVYANAVQTTNTRWTPPEQLPDSQAGQAYYWVVRPCLSANVCAPDPTEATNAFDKTSHPLEPTEPSFESQVADTVTFSWGDYLVANLARTGNERSRVEAKQYKVDVSTSETFQTTLDTATVDQTTYTSPAKIYPEGPLWWRVSVIDGSGNTVGTSTVQKATKASPPVALLAPAHESVTSITPALRWRPRALSQSYDVELYKDNDLKFSLANRLVATTSRLTAYSLTTPLPAATLPYVWRVRSRDVSGNPGPWSTARTFTVQGAAPGQLSPADGARVSATASLFTWTEVPGTSSYRFERRPNGGTTATETVNTVALAWAPTTKLGDGTWDWRVSTLDAAGKVIATSPWRTLRVDATVPTVTATTPASPARTTANVTATFSEPVRGVTTATMKLVLSGRTDPLSSVVSLSADKQKAYLNPAANLLVGRTYKAVLTSGVTDIARNPLVQKEWTFTVS